MPEPIGDCGSGTTEMHWHHAVIEPPDDSAGGKFKFGPEPRTRLEAKSALLPILLMADLGPLISLPDLCQRNASLATEWLCGAGSAIEAGGYTFVVLECESGDCERSFLAFQRMVADKWSARGRPAAIVLHGQDRDRPEGKTSIGQPLREARIDTSTQAEAHDK